MTFDPKTTEAQLALNLISSADMPKLAWEALEAGLDGPAIRRLAALEFPTAFQIREVLPHAMKEMHLAKLSESEAAIRLAKIRAQAIVRSDLDPFKHLRDFEQLWIQTDYCRELQDYGNLDDEVHVARCMKQPEPEIRAWLMERLKKLSGV
jgi:predicted phosphatase